MEMSVMKRMIMLNFNKENDEYIVYVYCDDDKDYGTFYNDDNGN